LANSAPAGSTEGLRRSGESTARSQLFATAYGLTSTAGLVDAVIDVQQDGIEQVRRPAEQGHQPQVRWVADGHLDDLGRRVAWSRASRHLFE
jgi:hypothetical protein